MRFRKIIKNATTKKSVVHKFNVGDMKNPIQTVTYAMPPLPALTYFYMQFIIGDFAWEKYPKYIEGTLKSAKVKDVFYYDLGEYIIRSSPYTYDEKWKFRTKKPTKSVLPERKKHLVLKKVEVENGCDTSRENDRSSRKVLAFGELRKPVRSTENRNDEPLAGSEIKVYLLRKRLSGTSTAKLQCTSGRSVERKQEIKVVAECSRRPKLRKR